MDATAADLLPRLLALRDELRAAPPSRESRVRPMPADAAASAANLNHYLAFRRHDARALQRDLARAGLWSLGRSESCMLESVEAVLANVERMAGAATAIAGDAMGMDEAEELLAARTGSLRPAPAHRHVRIMVTLPSEAASDPELAGRLVTAGMDCARINCVHDGPAAWTQMVTRVRAAAAAAGRPVQILMDVPGRSFGRARSSPSPASWRCGRRRTRRATASAPRWPGERPTLCRRRRPARSRYPWGGNGCGALALETPSRSRTTGAGGGRCAWSSPGPAAVWHRASGACDSPRGRCSAARATGRPHSSVLFHRVRDRSGSMSATS